MESNLISIITPVYMCENVIARTIESVRAQTHANWELLLIDDCSPDGSAAIVLDYAKKDPRIRYEKLAVNSGAAVARNTGIGVAKGRYLAFLDSDDLWKPEKLEIQISFMQKTGAAFTYTDYAYINNDDKITRAHIACSDCINYDRLVRGSIIMCSSVMLDLEAVGHFVMPNIRSGQDYATWTMLMRTKEITAYNVGENLSMYRRDGVSLSSNKIRAFRRTWRINRQLEGMSFWKCFSCISIYSFHWLVRNFLKKSKAA